MPFMGLIAETAEEAFSGMQSRQYHLHHPRLTIRRDLALCARL